MVAQLNATVVGVFEDRQSAQSAVRALKDVGFTESDIGVASANDSSQPSIEDGESIDKTYTDGTLNENDESYSGEGALTGAVAGAGIGALWGFGILAGALPAIGPAIAGGTLAVLLSSAAAGAAAAGVAGALIGMGFTEEEATFYESEVKAGRTIVTINAGTRRLEALSLIKQYGGYDMSTRSVDETLDATTPGISSYTPTSASATARATTARAAQSNVGNKTLQVHEEKLRVQKTPVETGEVTVRKEVHTDHKTIDVPVTREEVVIERRPATGAEISADSLNPGQEIRIPVKSEQVNVRKETVVAEEVTVGKRRVRDTEHIDETLRREEIKIDKQGDVNLQDEQR